MSGVDVAVRSPAKTTTAKEYVQQVMAGIRAKIPGPEFHQSSRKCSIPDPVLDRHPEYRSAQLLERVSERSWSSCSSSPDGRPGESVTAASDRMNAPSGRPSVLPSTPPCTGILNSSRRAGLQIPPTLRGRRQGRLGLRSEGEDRQRSDSLSARASYRAVASTSPARTSPRETSASAAGDRLPLRPVQRRQRFHRRLTGKGLAWAARHSGRSQPATDASTSRTRC